MDKKSISKVVGAGIVGSVAVIAINRLLGAKATGTILGSVLVMLAHEAFDAPVSGWVYKQM
ncbi:MAG: hypothetical protein M0Z69_11980 [Actinomycetota bacterium]|nr:hypothetical protein [Actinomycetota bacterium]